MTGTALALWCLRRGLYGILITLVAVTLAVALIGLAVGARS